MQWAPHSDRVPSENAAYKKLDEKTGPSLDSLKQGVSLDDHKLSLSELAQRYSTRINSEDAMKSEGLTSREAATRLKRDGLNRLTPKVSIPEYVKFLRQFKGLFQLLLIVGGALCFLSYAMEPADVENYYLGWVLWIVVVLTSVFAYAQESQSERLMEGFKSLAAASCKVVRDGSITEIDALYLVRGDVVFLKAGDKIPADVRVIQSTDMKVDNSSLTGEPDPLLRTVDMTHDSPLETDNLAFFGTLMPEGMGFGVVIACGDNTVLGRVAALADHTQQLETPLRRELNHFMEIITMLALFFGTSFFIIGVWMEGKVTLHHVVFVIGLIVANIPEGLLPMVTVALTLAAMRMRDVNVLVKNLEAVETLGSCTTIASDKTGTLTQNRMTVAHIYHSGVVFKAVGASNYAEPTFDREDSNFRILFDCAALCNRAEYDSTPGNLDKPIPNRKTIGDASDVAFMKFCDTIQNVADYRKRNPKLAEIPFNSSTKIHMCVCMNNSNYIYYLKGAPEKVLDRCTKYLSPDGKVRDLSPAEKERISEALLRLSQYGERILGFSRYVFSDEEAKDPEINNINNATIKKFADAGRLPPKELVFLGLLSMLDPPRPTVPMAIARCKSARIKVIMVTGDHPFTAEAIARQIGIVESAPDDIARIIAPGVIHWPRFAGTSDVVVGGTEIDRLTANDWDEILKRRGIVFARTTPQHKLIIVSQLQARGDTVAVTGDGVNDSPALKKADIGIAMGIAGSDVSKEAAKMILMDDNFASIVNGVEEGRVLFDNLKKSITYTLCSNVPELVPFIAYSLIGLPLPMSTMLILCIDLGTDVVPSIALAYEAPESDIMSRPPRDPKTDNLVNRRLISFAYFQIGIIQASAGFFAYFYVMEDLGYPPSTLPGAATDHFKNIADVTGKPFAGKGIAENLVDLSVAQSSTFISVVALQWVTILCCKTRINSFFTNYISNNALIFGIIFETIVACVLVYMPGVNNLFNIEPIPFKYWLCAVPYTILIFAYDEIRKKMMRDDPNGWVAQNTLW
eukprot:PhM_4_TR5799/c0_g1_i1/m.26956/K01539/ATP1A; sodium/potassium-transporting ATPase subunit alpha